MTTAAMWRNRRRVEIREDFEREVYGRTPKNTPRVGWAVASTERGANGDVPVIIKQLVGEVDNAAYPQPPLCDLGSGMRRKFAPRHSAVLGGIVAAQSARS